MGIETAIIAASIASAGAGIAGSVAQRKQAKKAQNVQVAPAQSPQVEGGQPLDAANNEKDETSRRIGRQALIATSPQGVLTTAPTGRRKLLGN